MCASIAACIRAIAFEEMVITDIKTNIPLHQALLRDPDVINGDYTIKWLEEWLARQES